MVLVVAVAVVVDNAAVVVVVVVVVVAFAVESSPALAPRWASLEDSSFLQNKDVSSSLWSRPRVGVLCVVVVVVAVAAVVVAVVVVVAAAVVVVHVAFAAFELW